MEDISQIKFGLLYVSGLLDGIIQKSKCRVPEGVSSGGQFVSCYGGGKFLADKSDVQSIKTLTKMVQYIDLNSEGHVDLPRIRAHLKQSSEFYGLKKVKVSELTIENKGAVADKAVPSKGAIVIDKNGLIIDGNHRTLYARNKGIEYIDAYVPLRMPR